MLRTGILMVGCDYCGKHFFDKSTLSKHIMSCLATCKEIHQQINHLISINTSDEMIIESLKAKFPLKDFNFMDIQHRFAIRKHEYARKKTEVINHLDNAFRNNDFHDGHKEVVKQIFNSIYNNDITSKEFAEKIKVEYDFLKFYGSFLDSVKGDHGEPTPRAYKIADQFVLDRINDSVIEETKYSDSGSQRKRSREDETNIRSFHQASTSSSSSTSRQSTPVHPILVPTAISVPSIPIHNSTELAVPSTPIRPISVPIVLSEPSVSVPDSTELKRSDSDSATTDDNFDVWTRIGKFVDKYTKRK